MCGYTRKDRMHTEELRLQVGVPSVEDSMCCKRLEWLGHLIRMNGSRLVSRAWGRVSDGKKARERPRWMYSEQVAADLAKGGLHRLEASDREFWKKVRQISKPQLISRNGRGEKNKNKNEIQILIHISFTFV